MELITKEIEAAFQKQGDTSEKGMAEIQIICKLFNPAGAGTWWLYEDLGDGIYMAFALLDSPMFAEIGTINIDEMKALKLPFGLGIERDTSVKPFQLNLKEVYDKVKGY